MLCEEVLQENVDHRLGQGIWRAGSVWEDSIDKKQRMLWWLKVGWAGGGNQSNRKESEMKMVRAWKIKNPKIIATWKRGNNLSEARLMISWELVLHNAQWELPLGRSRQSLFLHGERTCIPYIQSLLFFFYGICPRFEPDAQKVKKPELGQSHSCLCSIQEWYGMG